MLFVQLSDLHMRPRGRAAQRVSETNVWTARAFEIAPALTPKPELIVISGDLADLGFEEEYAELAQLLDGVNVPVRAVPGNHDRRIEMRAALAPILDFDGDSQFLEFYWRGAAFDIIGLDTLVEGTSSGALCRSRLDRLSRCLTEANGRPVVIVMHHPPFATGISHMDRMGLQEGAGAFAEIVAAHPNIERILCGHVHRAVQRRFAGAYAQIAPSVAHQVIYDLAPDAYAGFVLEPPAFLSHWWDGAGLVTHHVYVKRYAGPYPFFTDAADEERLTLRDRVTGIGQDTGEAP